MRVELAADLDLGSDSCAIANRVTQILELPANSDEDTENYEGEPQRRQAVALEDTAYQPAREGQAGYAGSQGQHANDGGEGYPGA